MSRILSVLVILLLLITQYRLWWGENGLLEYWQTKALVSDLEATNQKLQKRNARLNAEVEDLKSGLDAVAERARFDLGMIGKDETFFWLIGEPPAIYKTSEQTTEPTHD
ncbi:cell division protein FtsB [Marinospirillum insulare]|uniref:Cell division protein FtsB n=1 Tax=Marinospirillum insulare TaxID=217169 RepID=A0ABQ5ZU94_9GAMM|nr:cell division protein FtsB [Marinospirillum insulare]GLR63714.1 cell division protein FtsB [Marinospirillum insulare]